MRLLFDLDQGLHPCVLHLGAWTIQEALKRWFLEANKHAAKHGFVIKDLEPKNYDLLMVYITPVVALTIYLCSQNADYERAPRPEPSRTKKGLRFFPPDKPKIWDVGIRLGAAMRQHTSSEATGMNHNTPRPHIRRAHWHHFWTGPLTTNRKLVVKWLPPIPVGLTDEELPVVIKPVK